MSISDVINKIGDIFNKIGDGFNYVKEIPDDINKGVSKLTDGFGKVTNFIEHTLPDTVNNTVNKVEKDVVTKVDEYVGDAEKFFKTIENDIVGVYDTAKAEVVGEYDKVSGEIVSTYDTAVSDVERAWKAFICLIKGFWAYLGAIWECIFSYIYCGFLMILNLPFCLAWYLLEIVGYILYLPFFLFFYLFNLQKTEKQLWDLIKNFDKIFVSITGNSFMHFPESIVTKCYQCNSLKCMPVLSNYVNLNTI
jgi:hypothetical protein